MAESPSIRCRVLEEAVSMALLAVLVGDTRTEAQFMLFDMLWLLEWIYGLFMQCCTKSVIVVNIIGVLSSR
jgi:hypothetical protein